jgi:putative Mn2+ efflux pump MntP
MEGLGISKGQFFSWVIAYLTFEIDFIAGVIIGIAAVVALISFLKNLKKSTMDRTLGLETARLGLATSLLLALDLR